MSYHFSIKNSNNKISYAQILQSSHLPHNTLLSFNTKPEEIVSGYSKFHLPQLSSRGVAITATPNSYDIEINTGATKHDFLLATKIALALAHLNNADITPEFDNTLTANEFSEHYNEQWAEKMRHTGIDSILQLITEGHTEGVKFMGCVRDYYMGSYVINKLTENNNSKEAFNDSLIEEIRKMQFLEDYEKDIVFPNLMIATFAHGDEKKIMVIPINEKALIQKCDYVILNIVGSMMVKVPYNEFIDYISEKAKRVDEDSYIINAINQIEYAAIIMHFKATQDARTDIEKTATAIQKESKPDNTSENTSETKGKAWWQFWK